MGRVVLYDLFHPITKELIVAAGEEITEDIAAVIDESPIDTVEIRSVLTCAAKTGVCVKCYGRNLATNRLVQMGESVGVIAAQSIGEPGTQLTLRTFHVGGVAGNIASESQLLAKFDGRLEFDEVREVTHKGENESRQIVVSRSGEMRIVDPISGQPLMTNVLPYGAELFVKKNDIIKKGDKICAIVTGKQIGRAHV